MPESEASLPSINTPDSRQQAILIWLQSVLGGGDFDLQPASSDASFRRYFRITHAGGSLIVMDAPPDKENNEAFVMVAGLMEQAGLNAPRIIARDLQQGFLLLSDMGTTTYMSALENKTPDALMSDAIDALISWQLSTRPGVLPRYDRALLQQELALFPQWYVGRHLNHVFSTAQAQAWATISEQLIAAALAQPQVFVHRDYMPRNLMLCEPNPGILDFQDAVEGPIAYDVLSLFKDAFVSWAPEQVSAWRHVYWLRAYEAGLPVGDEASFIQAFDTIGLQRHLKVLGIFARICYRDGKPHYLQDTPRFIRYIREVLPAYPEFEALQTLFDDLGLEA